MCDVDYGEEADLWRETHHTARVEHKCSECGLYIIPGARYQRVSCLYDGQTDVYRTHTECAALLRHIAFGVCEQDYVYYHAQPIRDRVAEHLDDSHTISLYRQMVRARMREGTWPS